MDFDVIVVGAGAAGLAAARDLSAAGKRVCVLEARERIGGRIHTIRETGSALPIELGAEFIHGEAEETFAIVDAAGLLAYELPDEHWWSRGGRWTRVNDFWGEMARIRSRIGDGPDRSFADFIKSQRSLSPRAKELATNFVEGYHAAHADRISARALQLADGEQESGASRQFRIGSGYDTLMSWLRTGLDPQRSTLRLGTAVTDVVWREGHVAIRTARGEELTAKAAIITIPIGVWKAPAGQPGAISFTPELRNKQRAIAKLEVGHVVKIILRFRERFWDDEVFLDSHTQGRSPNFIHVFDSDIPTWWTPAPVRAPMLTAWAGGHAADKLQAESPESRIDRALQSLATTFGMTRAKLDALLDATHAHDWQADPFSRGAYSYAGVGGTRAHKELAKAAESTLFFAGEVTSGDETGTVAGAIASGKRAAREWLKSA
ncbi:MAG: hypothetical protein QOE82_181 [Thermoanaerobaculia bacterium]|nr:hypothetical protein [Thermoanaerobaculia bacterium]